MGQRRRDRAGRGGVYERVPELLHELIVDQLCAKSFDLRRLPIDYLLHPARGAVGIAARFVSHGVLGEIVRFREPPRGNLLANRHESQGIVSSGRGAVRRLTPHFSSGGRASDPQTGPPGTLASSDVADRRRI